MQAHVTQKGQSLIEILFAMAIFTMGIVTIGYLIISAIDSLRYGSEAMQARLLVEEGIEAVASIRDGDFDALVPGTYGLVLNDGTWLLLDPPDTQGKYSRTIDINDVDADIKEVVSTVTWTSFGDRVKTVTLGTHFSHWMQGGGDADSLDINTASAVLEGVGMSLSGIELLNTGGTDITITDIVAEWTPSSLLQNIVIQGSSVYEASTSAPISSGENIDISDYTIVTSSGTHTIDPITFDETVTGSLLRMTFVLGDGSRRSILMSL